MAVSKEILKRKLEGEEGFSLTLYPCTRKKWTGGGGINVEAQPMPKEVAYLWEEMSGLKILGNSGFMQGIYLREHGMPRECWELWMDIILEALETQVANRLHSEYDLSYGDLPEDAQIVIIDCSYQMGVNGFFAFKKTLGFIKRGDYIDASLEILDSAYHHGKTVDGVFLPGTPARAQRNSELLRLCGCKL